MSKIKYEFTKSENGILMISQIKTFEDSPIQEIDNYPIEHSVKLLNNQQSQIADLEAKLAESENCACKHISELTKIATEKDRKIEELKQQLAELKTENMNIFEYSKEVEQQLAEKENSVVLKPDKYVIVTNGWKKQGYGIARVHQEVRDVYYYCSNNRIGSFSPMTQYGEFETIEEAEAKLKELKKK